MTTKYGRMQGEFVATGVKILSAKGGFEKYLLYELAGGGIDVIHGHNPGGSWPTYMDMAYKKKPTIENIHCVRTACKEEELYLAHRIVGSTYNHSLQMSKNNLSIIPYPVSLWRYEAAKHVLVEKPEGKIVIGRLGNITGLKLPMHFIEVAKRLIVDGITNVQFLIMGDDVQNKGHLEDCRLAVKRYGLENYITFTGPITGNKFEAIRQLDICLYPTQRESFGIAMIEAMLCNIPVVTYDNCANKETVGVGGIVVGFSNLNALTQATKDLIASEWLRRKIGSLGRSLVLERNHPDVVVGKYEDIYRKVLS